MYEQNSFEPVARIVQLASHIEQKRLADIAYETRRFVRIGESEETISQRIADNSKPLINIYHYHCNHLGTPQELTNQDGDVIWLSYDRAWGGSFETIYKPQFIDNFSLDENELQPIKFQGQSLDTETGLHYNTFRYYDSDVGMFISRDPIGLLGGNNVFQYAPNPIGWIDPWGLECIKNKKDGLAREERAKEIYERRYGKDNVISEKTLRDANGKSVKDPITGEKRRLDFIVKGKDGKWRAKEVTSKTADKRDQLAKESRIRQEGGTYIRNPKNKKELIYVENLSTVVRAR